MRRAFAVILMIVVFAMTALAQAPATPANPPAPLPPITNTDYDISSTWFQLPAGMELGQPLAVAADGKGNLFLLRRRADPPIVVFDQQGNFIEQWAELGIRQPSGIYIEPDDTLWVGDNSSDIVLKMKDRKILETIKGLGGRPHLFTMDQGVLYQADAPANTFKRIRRK